ncbi:hypothetical protein [Microvirga lotononidis]|uniref:Uncharacterized protein n=1 Tax=Microvirga lotononidis TaxID=864069 RepID=I4YP17_9HYPH|nr:hypothetical protein [Microvirga lotononidis]EIM25709.1 hypothetical protein MicloDRAFT_00064360 [Microvirga lotononidis]WQO25645.1 hypothetical protein U0023_13055 [Microvirga lotononidis]
MTDLEFYVALGLIASGAGLVIYGAIQLFRPAPVNPIDWDEEEPCGDWPNTGGCRE